MRAFPSFSWTALSGVAALGFAVAGTMACSGDEFFPLGRDRDQDGWPEQLDCNDEDFRVFPGADEIPGDGIDQDCSGTDAAGMGGAGGSEGCVREGCDSSGGGAALPGTGAAEGSGGQGAFERGKDADGDGFAAEPEGTDCDDDRLTVYPGAVEIPLNGIDENCDGSDLVGLQEVVRLSEVAEPLEVPAIAGISNEGEANFLVVWSDSRVAPGQDLYGQLVDGSGQPIGDEIAIETEDNSKKSQVVLAANADGFLVSWVTADGIFVRQLDSEGTPEAVVLGIAPSGSVRPRIAFAGGHWAVTWQDGVDLTGWVRSMTETRARGDILQLGDEDEAVASLSIVGRDDDFVVAYSSQQEVSERALWFEERALTGYSETERVLALTTETEAFSEPVLAHDGEATWLIAARGKGLRAVTARTFELSPLSWTSEVTQLSTETLGLERLSAAVVGGGADESRLAVTWQDFRFLTGVPSVASVYGNWASISEEGIEDAWPGGRALLVSESAALGGTAAMGESIMMVALLDGELVVLPLSQ